MGRRHGRRRHLASCDCKVKSACYTTKAAADAAVVRVPGAERSYRGDCCGHYHITRYTLAEYSQRVAEFGVQDEAPYGTVATNNEDEEVRDGEAGDHGEPRPGRGDAGEAPQRGSGEARLAPSPATFARILEARRNQGR